MTPLPHDHPTPDRPHRIYVTLTNHCNRACPWCSTCSSPRGSTWLSVAQMLARVPADGPFELQLEGGEPTVHSEFWSFVEAARAHPRCTRLVVCTNGVVVPRRAERLGEWTARLGAPLTVKLSVNHYLLDRDPGLLALALAMRSSFTALGGDRLIVLNVRLRRGIEDDDARVARAIREAGLLADANVFYLQRYGFASDETDWDAPWLAGTNFTIVNPDGRVFGPDLVARSEAMRVLP